MLLLLSIGTTVTGARRPSPPPWAASACSEVAISRAPAFFRVMIVLAALSRSISPTRLRIRRILSA